jgi:hypothetical protein
VTLPSVEEILTLLPEELAPYILKELAGVKDMDRSKLNFNAYSTQFSTRNISQQPNITHQNKVLLHRSGSVTADPGADMAGRERIFLPTRIPATDVIRGSGLGQTGQCIALRRPFPHGREDSVANLKKPQTVEKADETPFERYAQFRRKLTDGHANSSTKDDYLSM